MPRILKHLESKRVQKGPMASTKDYGFNGCFTLTRQGVMLFCQISNGMGWEHVSVSAHGRCPTWKEMDYVKREFWCDNETVMQLHVPRKDHVDLCKHCLHLWRPIESEIPQPPKIMVG